MRDRETLLRELHFYARVNEPALSRAWLDGLSPEENAILRDELSKLLAAWTVTWNEIAPAMREIGAALIQGVASAVRAFQGLNGYRAPRGRLFPSRRTLRTLAIARIKQQQKLNRKRPRGGT